MSSSNTILAFDTSLGQCSVALWCEGAARAYRQENERNRQTSRLMPMIESAMREAGVAYGDLDRVACTIGPGSFTGIRIGVAVARCLAYAANKPVNAVTTLEALAWQHAMQRGGGEITVAINAYREQCYLQRFFVGATSTALTDAVQILVGDLPSEKVTVVNDPSLLEWVGDATLIPVIDSRAVASLAALRCPGRIAELSPLYIREPDAKLPASQPTT